MPPLILDGTSLARRRSGTIAARAAAVRARRGRAPRLVLAAFAEPRGGVPHIDRKVRACAAVGVDAVPLVFSAEASTGAAIGAMRRELEAVSADGVFLQFPFPDGIDGDALAAAVPVQLDVDIMTPARAAAFLAGRETLPPVTVAAGLLLLEAYRVRVDGMRGMLVADEHVFALMFREALARAGAAMDPLVPPAAPDLEERLRVASLVVVAAALPSLISSDALAPGTVAIDAGYFNAGARGDIDLSGGIDHLAALAPVPGGIGPMTVSALVERVVLFAETA